jgi:putative transposase
MLDPDDSAASGAPTLNASSADESPREAGACAVVREPLAPKDHAEAVAIFRSQVIGPLLTRHLEDHGALAATLREVCAEPHRPAWSNVSYRYATSTIERWYYAYRKGGLVALRPQPRSDRGHARALTPALRQLVLDIRQEHPSASAALILRTLVLDGRIPTGTISESTIRRLLEQEGLDRQSLRQGSGSRVRRRWEAEAPDALWHADVCHGPALKIGGRALPLRIHALLDDKSRFIPAIQACSTEREIEMLMLMVKAIRQGGRVPDTLYLDNGATYIGDALETACARLGITLRHARPHDPQARGKMERFWRTLRMGCLNHLGEVTSLHDVQVRLLAFVDRHYHVTPHASLFGKTPAQVYEQAAPTEPTHLSEDQLRDALTVRGNRRIRRDGTLDVGGICFETRAGFLAGRVATVARSLLDPTSTPWLEHEGQRFPLQHVDPVANARPAARPPRPSKAGLDLSFDPPGALLDALVGRKRGGAR